MTSCLYPSHLHNTCPKSFSLLGSSSRLQNRLPANEEKSTIKSKSHWIYWHSEDMMVTFDKDRSESTNADAEPARAETCTSG